MRSNNLFQDNNLVVISNNNNNNANSNVNVNHQAQYYHHYAEQNEDLNENRQKPAASARLSLQNQQLTSNDMWKQFEFKVKLYLDQFESMRKFCAYCGLHESSMDEDTDMHKKSLILGRCYGCQMVYYCSQEHQHLDWIENHMPKCAELEWVSLCELVESIPVDLLLLLFNDLFGAYWPEQDTFQCTTWTDWFEIRPNAIETVTELASTLYTENFIHLNKNLFLNRREPSVNDLVDGLLARVTDCMTYALTVGDALLNRGISPNLKPICIHLIYPPEDLIEDVVNFFELAAMTSNANIEKTFSNRLDQFYELVNMFPNNNGFEIVFIADIANYKNLNVLNNASTKINWSKMTYMRKNFANIYNFFITFWQGKYCNYIKYSNQLEEYYTKPDLVVSFHPSFTKSPQKLIIDWTDDLKVILTYNLTCLFTFYDKDEKEKAFNLLNAFQTNFVSIKSNQFSSLLLKQAENKPNQIYAKNGFEMIIKGFSNLEGNPSLNFNLMNSLGMKDEYKYLNMTEHTLMGKI